MPYVRKTDRQSWSQEAMKNAVAEVLAARMGYLKASKTFGVPQSTLEARVKKARTGLSLEDATKKGMHLNFCILRFTKTKSVVSFNIIIKILKCTLYFHVNFIIRNY